MGLRQCGQRMCMANPRVDGTLPPLSAVRDGSQPKCAARLWLSQFVLAAFQALLQLVRVGFLRRDQLPQVEDGGEPLLLRLAVCGFGAMPAQARGDIV